MNNIEKAELEFLRQNAQKFFFNTAIARREFWASKGEPNKAAAVQAELDAISSYTDYLEDKAQQKTPPQLVLNKFAKAVHLPNATNLEQAVLGAILIDSEAIGIVKNMNLKPAHFYLEKHAIIYQACIDVQKVDLLIINNQLQKSNQIEKIGGAYYLAELTNTVASCANVEFHSRILQQKFIQRELIKVCSAALDEAVEDNKDCFDLHSETIQSLENVLNFINKQEYEFN